MRKFSVQISILISLLCLISVNGESRSMSTKLNPDCPLHICNDSEARPTIIHVKADGNNDSLHYIWDLNQQPTILVALTELNTDLTIKWNAKLEDAELLTFSKKPKYTMSFILTKIFIFNDRNDTASLIGVNATDVYTVDTKDLTWKRQEYNFSANEAHVDVGGENQNRLGDEGVINLKLKCFGNEDHDIQIPHLLHSINVTQIDIEFVNLKANASFHSPRIAAEFVLVANETSTQQPFKISERKTVDDEHTPGNFRLIDVISPDGVNGTQGSYIQFRPISYTDEDRDINSGTGVHLNEPLFIADPATYLNELLAYSYFGSNLNHVLVQSLNVSFGQKEDGFYSRTNYTTWTIVIGYGTAPPERVSLIVIIIACIGMGIPLILLVAGGVYLAIIRMRNC